MLKLVLQINPTAWTQFDSPTADAEDCTSLTSAMKRRKHGAALLHELASGSEKKTTNESLTSIPVQNPYASHYR